MSDRRRFLQAAACAPLLAQPWAAHALSTKRPMRVREIWSSGEMLPAIGPVSYTHLTLPTKA